MLPNSIYDRKPRLNSMLIQHQPSQWNLHCANFINRLSLISRYRCGIIDDMNEQLFSVKVVLEFFIEWNFEHFSIVDDCVLALPGNGDHVFSVEE